MIIFSTQRSGTTAFYNAVWKYYATSKNPKFGLGEFLQAHLVGNTRDNTTYQIDQDFKNNVLKTHFQKRVAVLNTTTVKGFDYEQEARTRIEFIKYCIVNNHNPLLKIFPNSFINSNILEDIVSFTKEHNFDTIILYRQNLKEVILSHSIMLQYLQKNVKGKNGEKLIGLHNNTDNKPIDARPDPKQSLQPSMVAPMVHNYMSLMKLWQTNLCSQVITYEDMFFNNPDRHINIDSKPVSLSKIFDIKQGLRVYQMDYNGYAKEEFFNNSEIISEVVSQIFEQNNLTSVAKEMRITY